MKKLTSLFISGMLAVTGCVCAVTASAETEMAKITVVDGNEVTAVYEVPVGSTVECTVKGTSAEKITAFHGSIFVNQVDATTLAEESELDILGYAEAYFSNGVHYDPGNFGSMMVRPVSAAEFNRDELGFIYSAGLPAAGFDTGVDMIKVAYEVKNAGECTIVTTMNDVTYDDANGIPTKDITAISTVTTLDAETFTEDPTEEPTEAPTEEPTVAPTEAPTVAPTDEATAPTATEPTDATNPTTATDATNTTNATNATNATSATSATKAPTTNNSTTGKVATGDSTTIAVIMSALLLASAGTVISVRRRKLSK